jgi:multiple antibiotic resistance protein
MNPFSTAPLFVSLTAGADEATRRRQALLGSLYAFAIMAVFLLAGSAIVDFFGISVAGIRIAGGLVIVTLGFRMLFPAPPPPAAGAADPQADPRANPQAYDIAFAPIAMPSLAGPGSISVVLTSAAQIRSLHPEDWRLIYLAVILGMAVVLVFTYVVLRVSGAMVRFMGRTGIDAMTRIFGFLLISIGVQFLATGVADFFHIKLA